MAIGSAEKRRVLVEDALKHLLDCEESGGAATMDSLAGALQLRRGKAGDLLGLLHKRDLADPRGNEWLLTGDGRQYALQVVRTHRLYETYLARETGVPAEEWHRQANTAEHYLESGEVDELAHRLNNPRFDPHGDPIPTREGELPQTRRVSLAEWPAGRNAIIVHIEDEPESLFRNILRMGLHPGMVFEKIAPQAGGGVCLRSEGRDLTLPAEWLGMIHVAEVPEEEELGPGLARLSELETGVEALVHGLSPSCVGAERLRLLDLGLVPGTKIRPEFDSPFGSPRAYFIRGSMIALRREQAEKILVKPEAIAA